MYVTTLKAPGASKKQLSEKTDVTNRNLAKKRVTPPGGVHSHTKSIKSTCVYYGHRGVYVTTLKAPGAHKKQLSEKTDVTNRNLAQKRVTPPGGVHSHTKAIK